MAPRRAKKNEASSDTKTEPKPKNAPLPRHLEFMAVFGEYRTMNFTKYSSAGDYAEAFLKLRRDLHQRFGRPAWPYGDIVLFVSNVEKHSEWKNKMWTMIEITPVTLEWVIEELLKECGEDTEKLKEIFDLINLDPYGMD